MAIQLQITERDENGSYFRCKFNAQGAYDCEIKGYFKHDGHSADFSTWDVDHLNNFGKVNGLAHYPVSEILSLLGNGCMDIGTELLDEMLKPHLDTDFYDWCEWREIEERNAQYESQLNNDFYRRQAGF